MRNSSWYSDKVLVLKHNCAIASIEAFLQEAQNSESKKWATESLEFLVAFTNQIDSYTFTTSGSTGEPKKIEFTREQVVASANQTIDFFGIKATWTLLQCLPASFVAGKMMLARAVCSGAAVVLIEPALNPLLSLYEIDFEIDFAAFTPAQLQSILEDDASTLKLNTIKNSLIGGGALSDALSAKLSHYTGITWQSYGMTETLTHVAIKRTHPNPSENFTALNNVTFGLTAEGCLVVHANHLGIRDLVTTDIVELIDETHFIWKGRADNIINSGGIKINPEVVENELKGYLDYTFFITKKSHEKLGETVVLVIEKQILSPQETQDLKDAIGKLSNKHFKPTSIGYCATFARTSSHKIQREKTLLNCEFKPF